MSSAISQSLGIQTSVVIITTEYTY